MRAYAYVRTSKTIIGLYKTELIRRQDPQTLDNLEHATLEWVDWFTHCRLLEPIGHIPSAEFEETYCHRLSLSRDRDSSNRASVEPGSTAILASARVLKGRRSRSSHSSVAKKLLHMALSRASPRDPMEGRTPASRQQLPKAIEVY